MNALPTVGYDIQIEEPGIFYLSFDNAEVGRIQARGVVDIVNKGRFAYIKGSPTMEITEFVWGGQVEFLTPYIEKGDIEIVCELYSDGWLPENAQINMEQCLTANNNNVDAVVASNDGTAGGVVAALASQGLAGNIPVSGQDGDIAALNRIAKGYQTVSAWKNACDLGRAGVDVAIALAEGTPADLRPHHRAQRRAGGGHGANAGCHEGPGARHDHPWQADRGGDRGGPRQPPLTGFAVALSAGGTQPGRFPLQDLGIGRTLRPVGAFEIAGGQQELAADLAARELEVSLEELHPRGMGPGMMGVEPGGERAVRCLQRLNAPGVLDRGIDFEPVANDARIGEQA